MSPVNPLSHLTELAGISSALSAAAGSGLLAALLESRTGTAELAAALRLDALALERVLSVLEAFGIAESNEHGFTASAALREFDALSPGGLGGALALWSLVPDFLARGKRLGEMDGQAREREKSYKDVVGQLGRLFAPAARQLAQALPPAGRILDLGAGSGIWSLSMAASSAQTRVCALDFAEVLPACRRQAEAMGLSEQLETLAGDYHAQTLPEGMDRIVLANILHLESAEAAADLLARCAAALPAGAELVIVDVYGGESPHARRMHAIYGLHLALRTRQGTAHALNQLQSWLKRAGLSEISLIELDDLIGLGAIRAVKQD